MLKYFKNYQITLKNKKTLKIFNKFYQLIKLLTYHHQVNCKSKCKGFNKKKTKVNLQIITVTNKIKINNKYKINH